MGYLVAMLVYLGIGVIIADRFFRRRHGVSMKRGRGLAGLDVGLMSWGAVLFTWPVAMWLRSVREPRALRPRSPPAGTRRDPPAPRPDRRDPPAGAGHSLIRTSVTYSQRSAIIANINENDRVITTVDLGSGAGKGTKETVTHVSVFHGLATMHFDTGKEVMAIKLHYLSHA